MFNEIHKFIQSQLDPLAKDERAPASDDQIKLATAALMYEVAGADNSLDEREQRTIVQALASAFDISQQDSEKLTELAQAQASDAVSLHAFTSVITKEWPYEERSRVIEMMWDVALADGRLDDHEQHLMRKLASLLYIPHSAYIAAKIRAQEKRAGISPTAAD